MDVPELKVEEKVEPKVEEQKVEPKVEEVKEEDIVSRVSGEIKPVPKQETNDIFNINDIDSIEDPKAREYAQKAYKSFEKGYQKKYQELAETRKTYEQKLAENIGWTKERMQKELKDPEFVKIAQSLAEEQEQVDPETVKIKQKVETLENQLASETMRRQDEILRNKYKDYDAGMVDDVVKDLQSGKIQATKEDFWKIIKFDDYMKRAYSLGKQDRKIDLDEKIQSSSAEGITATGSEEVPKPKEGERDEDYFNRIALFRLNQYQRQATKPKKE